MRIRYMLGCTVAVYPKGAVACGLRFAIVKGSHGTVEDMQDAARRGLACTLVRKPADGLRMSVRT